MERSLFLSLQFKYSQRVVENRGFFLRAELARLSFVFRTEKAIFPYSVRENTPAALMEQVPVETRRRRAKELRAIAQIQLEEFTKEQSKFTHKVLIENETTGRTENYLTVKLHKDILKNHKIGDVVELKF